MDHLRSQTTAARRPRRGFRYLSFLPVGTALACAATPEPSPDGLVGTRGDALAISDAPIGTEKAAPVQYYTGNYLATASGKTTNLVVFYDGGLIRGMRYDAAGTPLDLDQWLLLGRNGDTGDEGYPDLAFGADVYLVVYIDYGDDAPGLYTQAVSEAGLVLSKPTLVHPDCYYGAVVFNGTDFTVAAYDGDIHLSRVALDGTPIDGSSTPVTTSGVNNRPQLAMTTGGDGLVVFEQDADGMGRQVYAARFSADGTVLDPGGILISDGSTSSVDVSVAAGQDQFLAVWTSSDRTAVFGSVIGADGSVDVRQRTLSRSTADVGGSAVTFDGTNYLVAWDDRRNEEAMIFGTRVGPDGAQTDPADVPLAGPSRAYQSWDIDLHWTGTSYALTYAESGIFGGFFDTSLAPLGPQRIGLTALPSPQGFPVNAFDGSNFVVAYSDERNEDFSEYTLRSVRIGPEGALLDPEGIAVSEPEGPSSWVMLASNQRVSMFSYRPYGSEDTQYRVLDQEGNLSAPATWQSGGDQVALASNGDTFVGLYGIAGSGEGNADEVWGQSFDASGTPTGDAYLVAALSRPRGQHIGFGEDYLYAYSGQGTDGAALDGDTVTFDSQGTVTASYGPVTSGILTASAASNGDVAIYSWQADDETLWARLLDRADGWGDSFQLSDQPAKYTPGLAWDGEQFVVVFTEDRMALWTLNVGEDGTTTQPERLLDGDFSGPTIAVGEDGSMLLSYIHWGQWSRTRRVESRFLGTLPVGVDTEETPEQPADDTTDDDMPMDTVADDDTSVADETDKPAELADDTPAPDDAVTDDDGPSDGVVGDDTAATPDNNTPNDDGTAAGDTDDGAGEGNAAGDSDAGAPEAQAKVVKKDDGFCSVSNVGGQGGSHLGWLSLGALALLRRPRRR